MKKVVKIYKEAIDYIIEVEQEFGIDEKFYSKTFFVYFKSWREERFSEEEYLINII